MNFSSGRKENRLKCQLSKKLQNLKRVANGSLNNFVFRKNSDLLRNEERNCSSVMKHQLTALSMPRVISMMKKMIAQAEDPGRVAIASGYTMNTSPGPVGTQKK